VIAYEDIPDGVDGDVLRRMRRNEDSLTQPRSIDFSVVFPTEQAAIAFCEAIAEYQVELCYQESGVRKERPWDVTVARVMVPDHEAIISMEEWIAGYAGPLDGHNDGWGCFDVGDMATN
jgi:hypothetical protein